PGQGTWEPWMGHGARPGPDQGVRFDEAPLHLGGRDGRRALACVAHRCHASVDASGTAGALAGTWGTAAEVPGTAALNQGGNAETSSVSCASASNCSAGGYYSDSSGSQQAFVVSQASGTWGTAIEVPGAAALNQGGNAETSSV